jgi:hypothetical protein
MEFTGNLLPPTFFGSYNTRATLIWNTPDCAAARSAFLHLPGHIYLADCWPDCLVSIEDEKEPPLKGRALAQLFERDRSRHIKHGGGPRDEWETDPTAAKRKVPGTERMKSAAEAQIDPHVFLNSLRSSKLKRLLSMYLGLVVVGGQQCQRSSSMACL